MRDIPIIFSAPMVAAQLAGHKTMTRRLAWRDKPDPADDAITIRVATSWQKVKPGDRLWVRENFYHYGIWRQAEEGDWHFFPKQPKLGPNVVHAQAEEFPKIPRDRNGYHLRPSIYMPRWASRITWILTATKMEPLQSIGDDDARAEGIGALIEKDRLYEQAWRNGGPRHAFEILWDNLHGEDAWAANPAVVAMTGTVHQINIDKMKKAA